MTPNGPNVPMAEIRSDMSTTMKVATVDRVSYVKCFLPWYNLPEAFDFKSEYSCLRWR